MIWRTPSRTQGSRCLSGPLPAEATNTQRSYCSHTLRYGRLAMRLLSGWLVVALCLTFGCWQPLSANPANPTVVRQAASANSPTQKPSTPTGAPSTASSGATIAIASGHEVGAASFRGYPIVELSCSAFRTSCGPERASSTPPAYTDPTIWSDGAPVGPASVCCCPLPDRMSAPPMRARGSMPSAQPMRPSIRTVPIPRPARPAGKRRRSSIRSLVGNSSKRITNLATKPRALHIF